MVNIEASQPTVVEPAAVPPPLDTWFLENLSIRGNVDRTMPISLNAMFVKGTELKDAAGNVTGYYTDANHRTHFQIENLFSVNTMSTHPEIAALMPQFLAALDAVGKRLGVL